MKFAIFILTIIIVGSTATPQIDAQWVRDQAKLALDPFENQIKVALKNAFTDMKTHNNKFITDANAQRDRILKSIQPALNSMTDHDAIIMSIDARLLQMNNSEWFKQKHEESWYYIDTQILSVNREHLTLWAQYVESGVKPLKCVKAKFPEYKANLKLFEAFIKTGISGIKTNINNIIDDRAPSLKTLVTQFQIDLKAKCKTDQACITDYVKKMFFFLEFFLTFLLYRFFRPIRLLIWLSCIGSSILPSISKIQLQLKFATDYTNFINFSKNP